jgi:hypothetical protein
MAREDIEAAYSGLKAANKFLAKKSIMALDQVLGENERILGLAAGWYENWQGALCCTSEQVVFVQKRMLGGLKVERFAFDRISSIERKSFLGLGAIIIRAGSHDTEIKQIETVDLDRFLEAYELARTPASKGLTSPAGVSDLERLVALLEKGHLTPDEFAMAKQKFLHT